MSYLKEEQWNRKNVYSTLPLNICNTLETQLCVPCCGQHCHHDPYTHLSKKKWSFQWTDCRTLIELGEGGLKSIVSIIFPIPFPLFNVLTRTEEVSLNIWISLHLKCVYDVPLKQSILFYVATMRLRQWAQQIQWCPLHPCMSYILPLQKFLE